MITPRILATTIAAILTAATLHAQTWDGGDATLNNFNAPNNWNPNAVPVNNGTANLIFAGVVRLAPVVNVNFDVSGVTFNNTAGAFNISASGGSVLTVRGGGITNNDADLQVFSTPVTFATGSAITAASGDFNFIGTTTIGANNVTVSGAFDTTFGGISGTGILVKNGTGPLIFASSALQNNGLNVNAGAIAQVPDQLKYSILVGFGISLVCVLWCADWFSSFAQENLRAMTYFFWAARPDPPKCKVGRAN